MTRVLLLLSPFLLAMILLSSCASMQHCKPDKLPLPDESQFTKIANASHGDKYPFWQTKSAGPPVLLLHAMNGISPRTAELALEMESWGLRVYLPSLYGPEVFGNPAYGYNSAIKANGLTMLSDDWDTTNPDEAGQILEDIREMTRWISQREGGQDVAVVGNCLTGIFPLALLDEPHISKVALCQPATPIKTNAEIALRLRQSKKLTNSLGISREQLDSAVRAMKQDHSKQIYGFHYLHDPLAAIEKFERLNAHFAENGVSDQFKTFVLKQKKASQRDDNQWTEVGETLQRQKMFVPHSTVINPERCEDREWFRTRLKRALTAK